MSWSSLARRRIFVGIGTAVVGMERPDVEGSIRESEGRERTMSTAYVAVLHETKNGELDAGERYLAGTRLSLPRTPRRVEEQTRGLSVSQLREQFRLGITRSEPQRIPGFPTAWDMAVGLTPQRLVVWNVGGVKGAAADRPGELLGTVRITDLVGAEMATVPDRRGRTLAVKFILRHGPRVLLDVVTGFRPDTEELVEEMQAVLQGQSR